MKINLQKPTSNGKKDMVLFRISQINNVIRYIQNQEEHHKTKTFIEEYKEMLEKFEIEYDEKYIFKELI